MSTLREVSRTEARSRNSAVTPNKERQRHREPDASEGVHLDGRAEGTRGARFAEIRSTARLPARFYRLRVMLRRPTWRRSLSVTSRRLAGSAVTVRLLQPTESNATLLRTSARVSCHNVRACRSVHHGGYRRLSGAERAASNGQSTEGVRQYRRRRHVDVRATRSSTRQ